MPAGASDDVLRIAGEAMSTLRDLGAIVEETRFPLDLTDLMTRNGRLIAAEAYALHRAYIGDPALPIDPWVRARTLSGKAIGAADYIDELVQRRRAAARFALWMRGRDALLSPTLPITATPVADVDESTTPLATYTRAANYLGACALSLPAGFSAGGLPVGVQLMGAPFAEATLIAIGRAYQRATDWHLRRPDLTAWS
jgi:aspartyl-tRNA(Asn)/glutamyl-tRNA(Gln) amidotransferase subunit A